MSSNDSIDENWINARRAAHLQAAEENKAALAADFAARCADAIAAKMGTVATHATGVTAVTAKPRKTFRGSGASAAKSRDSLSRSKNFNAASPPKEEEEKEEREKEEVYPDDESDDGSNANYEFEGGTDEDVSEDERAGGLQDLHPQVNSPLKGIRIDARRLRIAKKCEENRLQDLDLDPFEPVIAEYVSKSHQQICESRLALLQLRDSGQRLETQMRVLTDVSTKRHEALEAEMTASRALAMAETHAAEEIQIQEIRAKWNRRFAIEKPTEMARLWEEQTQGCSDVIGSKDSIIAELRMEILRREKIFNDDLLFQGRDITTLFDRIKETVARLRKTFRKQLDLIEESFYDDRKKQLEIIKDEAQQSWDRRAKLEARRDRERLKRVQSHADEIEALVIEGIESYNLVKRKLDGETLQLEQELNTVKARQMLNTEKLDYNLQVLRRRDVENVFTKNSNSKKLSRKLTYFQHLQNQEAEVDAERKKRLKQLHLEIEKFTVKVERLSKRYMDFLDGAEKTFHDVWMMNEEECHSLVDAILHVDETLRTQQLGETQWKPPESIAEILKKVDPWGMDEEDDADERCGSPPPSLFGNQGVSEGASAASKELFLNMSASTVDLMMSCICDEGGFLVEDRVLKIIAPKVKRERELVTLDAVFEALGVKILPEMAALTKYFAAFMNEKTRLHERRSHHERSHHDFLGEFAVPSPSGHNYDNGNRNNDVEEDDRPLSEKQLEFDIPGASWGVNFNRASEDTNARIEIQLDRCSTETPSTSRSWAPPEKNSQCGDDDENLDFNGTSGLLGEAETAKTQSTGLLGEAIQRRNSETSKMSKRSGRSNNNPDGESLVDPKDIVRALKSFVEDFPKFGEGKEKKKEFDATLPHLPTEEGQIAVIEEEKDEEELDRKVTTMIHALEQRHQETRRSRGEEDTKYWEMLRNPVAEDRLRVWKALEKGLTRVKEVLRARKTLRRENDAIRKQNEELRQLLQQQLQSGVNGFLQEPPREVLHYGPP